MGMISRAAMPARPQEIGKIKIGGVAEQRASSGGGSYGRPVKYDHFVVTTRERGNDGNFVRDARVHDVIGDEPRTLDAFLMFPDPADSFHSELSAWKGKTTKLRECDGLNWTDPTTGNVGTCTIGSGKKTCDCKPYGRLALQLADAPDAFGFHVFRTTSWESVNNIQTALEMIRDNFGSCYRAPVRLVVYEADVTYTDGAKRKTGTAQKVGLVLRMPMEEAGAMIVAAERDRAALAGPDSLRALAAGVRADLDAADGDDVEGFVREFHPDRAIAASVGTRATLDGLKSDLGVGLDPDAEVPAAPVRDDDGVPTHEAAPDEPAAADGPANAPKMTDEQAVDYVRGLQARAKAADVLAEQYATAIDAACESKDIENLRLWASELRRVLRAAGEEV